MLRLHTLAAAVAALALLAGCSRTAAPPAGDPSDPPPSAAADGEFDQARRTWQARRPAAYAYDLAIACLCIHRGEYRVEVRGDEIASVRMSPGGAPAPESRVEWIVTVDRLFEAMAQAAQLGYPVEAEIGLLADDSGTLYRIQNLRAM